MKSQSNYQMKIYVLLYIKVEERERERETGLVVIPRPRTGRVAYIRFQRNGHFHFKLFLYSPFLCRQIPWNGIKNDVQCKLTFKFA